MDLEAKNSRLSRTVESRPYKSTPWSEIWQILDFKPLPSEAQFRSNVQIVVKIEFCGPKNPARRNLCLTRNGRNY